MLPDPTKLPLFDPSTQSWIIKDSDSSTLGVTTSDVFHATSFGVSGSSRRGVDSLGMSSVGQDTLSIQHSTSNESKPLVTDRHLIRLDHVVHDDANAIDVKSYVYVVVGQPRSNLVTNADMQKLACALFLYLMGNSDYNGSSGFTLNADTLQRVLYGES